MKESRIKLILTGVDGRERVIEGESIAYGISRKDRGISIGVFGDLPANDLHKLIGGVRMAMDWAGGDCP